MNSYEAITALPTVWHISVVVTNKAHLSLYHIHTETAGKDFYPGC